MANLIRRIEEALQQETALDEKLNWRKLLGTAALAGTAALSPMKAHAAGSEEQWEAALNNAWTQLSPKQQQELRQEERAWIKWKEQLPDDERYWAIEDRVQYLDTYKEKGLAAARQELKQTQAERAYNLRRNKQVNTPTPRPTPAPTPEPALSDEEALRMGWVPSLDEIAAMSDARALEIARELWDLRSDQQKKKLAPYMDSFNKRKDYKGALAFLRATDEEAESASAEATPTPTPQPTPGPNQFPMVPGPAVTNVPRDPNAPAPTPQRQPTIYELAKEFYLRHPSLKVGKDDDNDADADTLVQGMRAAYEAVGHRMPGQLRWDSQGNFDPESQAALDDFGNFSKAFLDAYKQLQAGGGR